MIVKADCNSCPAVTNLGWGLSEIFSFLIFEFFFEGLSLSNCCNERERFSVLNGPEAFKICTTNWLKTLKEPERAYTPKNGAHPVPGQVHDPQ